MITNACLHMITEFLSRGHMETNAAWIYTEGLKKLYVRNMTLQFRRFQKLYLKLKAVDTIFIRITNYKQHENENTGH